MENPKDNPFAWNDAIQAMQNDNTFKVSENHPQRQDSLNDQMHDLILLAEKNGMYDAADYLKNVFEK